MPSKAKPARISTFKDLPPKIVAWHKMLLEDKTDRSSGCWIWTGKPTPDGYATTAVGCVKMLVHRVAYLLLKGDIPTDAVVRHVCPGGGNRLCVNPDHLKLGTRGDNNRDTTASGRHRPRLAYPVLPKSARTDPDTQTADAYIRRLHNTAHSQNNIAQILYVPVQHVREVLECSRSPMLWKEQTPADSSRPMTHFERRFWGMVRKTPSCWIWLGRSNSGYGRIRIGGNSTAAHQTAWRLHNGPIPDGLVVCHNCPGGDNSMCVNPTHLFLASQGDNMRDFYRKKRGKEAAIFESA